MISAGDLRKGTTFEYEGQVYTVIDFLHVKPGKGAAFVRTKLRNVISGGVTDTTFNPTAKLQEAVIERKEMQYLYSDGELYYFMDQETYEQIPLNYEKVSAWPRLRSGFPARVSDTRSAPSAASFDIPDSPRYSLHTALLRPHTPPERPLQRRLGPVAGLSRPSAPIADTGGH